MKKKVLLAILTFLLTVTLVGPVSAYAVEVNNQPSEQSDSRATEYVTYYKTVDGVCYYRIWNATYGRWETPWLPC